MNHRRTRASGWILLIIALAAGGILWDSGGGDASPGGLRPVDPSGPGVNLEAPRLGDQALRAQLRRIAAMVAEEDGGGDEGDCENGSGNGSENAGANAGANRCANRCANREGHNALLPILLEPANIEGTIEMLCRGELAGAELAGARQALLQALVAP